LAGLGRENVAFAMKCLCLPDPHAAAGTEVDHVRLFRNDPAMRWTYRVHEQILPAVRKLTGEVRPADVVIHHVGYQDPVHRAAKHRRDLRLLQMDFAEHPDDPYILFNLGWSLEELRQPAAALPLLLRSLARSHPADSIVRKLHALIVACYRQLGQMDAALAACQTGLGHYPEDAGLLFEEARLHRDRRDFFRAEQCLLHLLNGKEGPHFASVAAGLRGPLGQQELAALYLQQRRFQEAEAQCRLILADQPNYLPAWIVLAEALQAQGRPDEAAAIRQRLSGQCV